ncbi:MAG: hypothetical protein Q7U59_10335 [Lutibacter sp.]|nr:hypothetical protein [Lutibacter sp.]
MKKLILLSVLLLSSIFSCKNIDLLEEEEQILTTEEQRVIDADFNNSITPGVKNVFYEDVFVPNRASQLVLNMTYFDDTFAAYGKINNIGQLEYIHTTVLMKKGGNELFVTEIFPDISKSRMYTIINNLKGNIVVDIKHFSPTKFTISLIDLNWSTGEETVIMSSLISDGKKIAEFSSKGLDNENRVWNCDEPQPSDNLDKTVDNHLDYFVCGGLAWDTHPNLIIIKKTITSFLEKTKNLINYQDKKEEISFFDNAYKSISNFWESVNGKIGSYKYEKSIQTGQLKQLEESINEYKGKETIIILLPFEELTVKKFDEVIMDDIKFTFVVNDVETGLPYTRKPVYVDIEFSDPNSDSVFNFQTKATSMVNGIVSFSFDPKTIPEYEKYSSIQATYNLSENDLNTSQSRSISLNFIKPIVVFKNGEIPPSTIMFGNEQTKFFKLINEDRREISVDYKKVTINNLTNVNIGYVLILGTVDFSLKLYTNETTSQTTSLDLYYNTKKIQTISATVMDSLEVYQKAAIGNWTVTTKEYPERNLNLVLYANNTGIYIGDNGIPYSNGGYPISWSIKKHNNRFYLYESGFWHPGYNQFRRMGTNLPNEYLSYPITFMKTYGDLGDGPIESLTYTKE